MIYHKIENIKDIEEMSFENYFQSGRMIGGEIDVVPTIYLWSGREITDIRIGYKSYTTWAHEKNRFKKGETIAECIARHGASVNDIEKIVVDCFDTTGKKDEVSRFIWTPKSGWTEETTEEI